VDPWLEMWSETQRGKTWGIQEVMSVFSRHFVKIQSKVTSLRVDYKNGLGYATRKLQIKNKKY